MAGKTIQIPSFNFAAFFYPEILESLIIFKRQNLPELTDESDFEPSIQLLRAFALTCHLSNVLTDMVANESTLPTAKLPETVRNMLRLIGFEVSPATPAQTEVMLKLSRVFTTTREVVPARAQFASRRRNNDDSEAYFEALTELSAPRTDQLGACFVEVGGVFTDRTSHANVGTNFSFPCAVGNKLYLGHAAVMWGRINVEVVVGGAITSGVWEYYDGDVLDVEPDTVNNIGGGVLRLEVSTLLGTQNRVGAEVTVTLNSNGASEVTTSQWDGSVNYVETSLLGQSSPSVDPTDYTVGVEWQELRDTLDSTSNFSVTENVDYSFPQTESENWKKTTVNDFNGFFIRCRIVEVSGASAPTLARIRMDTGDQYVITDVVQGRSIVGEILGSSNGDANQEFESSQDDFITGSAVLRVGGETWTQVDNFLSSSSQDRHYRVQLGKDDRATFIFGDGVTGRIPDVGQGNIVADYRHGADSDGNVGARTVVVDKTGLSFVDSVTNPRQAAGWAEADTASDAALERVKIEGPASLRTREIAVSPSDLESLTPRYTAANGSRPFSRSVAIEEGFGPKTIEQIVVARGGGQATGQQLKDIDLYYNGDGTVSNPKRIVANQEVTSVNFKARPVDVDAVVWASVDLAAETKNQLAAILQPEALQADGVTYVWEFGSEVPRSRIIHEIFQTDKRITKVVVNVPAEDAQLERRELPTNGTFNIAMIITD